MAGLIGWLTGRMRRARTAPAFQRDPAFLKRWTPTLTRALRWFSPSIEGGEYVPADSPLILVANHSGGMWTPEAYVLVDWWVRTFGPQRPLYLLAHDFLFAIPLFTRALRRAGGIPASMDNARRALDNGGAVLVFPGGDQEAFRPWWDRHRIDFGGRTGFVRLALASGAPVLPAVCHGSHDTTIVLTRGRRIARRLRLGRMRSEIMPFVLGPPWGIVPGFVPTLPLPAQIRVRLLPMLPWSGDQRSDDRGPAPRAGTSIRVSPVPNSDRPVAPPGYATNRPSSSHVALGARSSPKPDTGFRHEALIRRCYDQTTRLMQRTLDAMAREQPWPLFARWQHTVGSAGPT